MTNISDYNELDEVRIIDERKNPFFIVDKYVIWNWIPFIGTDGYALYCLYISLINKEKGFAFPSLKQIARFLKRGRSTIVKYNNILEQYGLIRIERKLNTFGAFTANNYYILDVPEVPENLIPELMECTFIKNPNAVKRGWSRTGLGGHVQDWGGHVQDWGGHVQDSKENKYKYNNKERDPSELIIPSESIFSTVPMGTVAKLAQQYSPETVLQAIHSLDYVYRDNRRSIRSPLALLKIALRDGFDPISEMEKPKGKKQIYSRQSEEELEDFKTKWEEINRKKHLLPPTIKDGWEKLLDLIHAQIGSHVADAWFTPLVPIAFEDDTLLVYAPGQTIIKGLNEKYSTILKKLLIKNALGFKKLQFVNTVDSESLTGFKKK